LHSAGQLESEICGMGRYCQAMTCPGEPPVDHFLSFSGMRRVLSDGIELFTLRQFLTPSECAGLIALIDANRRPSTIADANGDAYFRTSETCDLDHADRLVIALNAKLAWISGIDPGFGEPLQGQRYGIGQEFKAHTDYFEPDGADFQQFCATSGQRSWTFMIYLNDVSAGGGTRFPEINRTFQPKLGTLLAWNNRLSDGRCNPATLHQGIAVRKGAKYVVTRWYRERMWG
jgi:prolyl 4-hydroxylase